MSIDVAAAYSDLYARAATHADGAAVRALLGTNGLFTREQLNNLSGRVLPYLVWADRGLAGQSGEMRSVNATWFVYVARNGNPRALHQIATALDVLYGSLSRFDIAAGRLGVTFIGPVFVDDTLGLKGIEVRIGYTRLG